MTLTLFAQYAAIAALFLFLVLILVNAFNTLVLGPILVRLTMKSALNMQSELFPELYHDEDKPDVDDPRHLDTVPGMQNP